MEIKCSVDGCDRDVYVVGKMLCSTHYNRLRTTGTVEDGQRAKLPLEKRFSRYFVKKGPDDCWPWTGKQMTKGYGSIAVGGRSEGRVLAHRLAFEIANGPIISDGNAHGRVVRHKCDNRLCVNPSHLELGSQADNVRDQIERGNFSPVISKLGEQHHNSRFTESDVRYIRSSSKTNAELGREFKCARQTIGFVRRLVTWKHI